MRVLLDTCVLSELRRKNGSEAVKKAVETISAEDLYVSVITIGEIYKGIALLKDEKQRSVLQTWIGALESHYADRVLPVDLDTVRIWGELTAQAQNSGRVVPAADGLIAATARRNGLYVMTRNVRDFEPTGAMLTNPWVK